MSVICQNFVQNTWKKDLCSNCFKSLSDHSDTGHRSGMDRVSAGRYIPQATSLYQSRGMSSNIHWRTLLGDTMPRLQDPIYDKIACRDFGSQTSNVNSYAKHLLLKSTINADSGKGILKEAKSDTKLQRSSVGFTSEEPLVIGYGGRDYDSDDSPWELGSDDGSINLDLLDLTDEDRTITKLTKNNTEFNSDNDNLISSPELRETSSQTQITKETNAINNWNSQYTKKCPEENLNDYRDNHTTQKVNSGTDKIEKKLDYYFFSTKEEPARLSTPKNIEPTNYLNQTEYYNRTSKTIPGIINNLQGNTESCLNVENLNKKNSLAFDDNVIQTLQNDEFKPVTLSSYSLISKINNSEISSDSDYSTSRQTNGESSTDSESFHDAEEPAIMPCSSFLHGTAGRRSSIPPNNELIPFISSKPYESSSLSSGEVSTLSDDSDSQTPEKISGKSRNYYKSTKPSGASNKQSNAKSVNAHSKNLITTSNTKVINSSPDASPIQSNTRNSVSEHNNGETCNLNTKTYLTESRPSEVAKVVNDNKDSNAQPTTTSNAISKVKSEVTSLIDVLPKNDGSKVICARSECELPTQKSLEIEKHEVINAILEEVAPKTKEQKLTDVETPSKKQNELIECKNWLPANEEWESIMYTPQSTPSLSSTTTETDDRHSPFEIAYQEKEDTESNLNSNRNSPDSKLNRQSKLAALALELEKVRCESNSTISSEFKTPLSPDTPPKVTPRGIPPPKMDKTREYSSFASTPTSHNTSNNYPSIRRGRSISSAADCPKSLPDILPESATKLKKGRFSLKKLLKRNKDTENVVIVNSTSNTETNRKAWKHQTFDRSRLSLEIVHPMDLTSDSQTSTETTPTEESRHSLIFMDPSGRTGNKSGAPRARSLSALPLLSSCINEIIDPRTNELQCDITSSLDRPKMEHKIRKAGTVAERSKKNKAPMRTPSFSALHSATSSGHSTGSGAGCQRPPKPPPPPRGKSLHSPQTPIVQTPTQQPKTNRNSLPVPARPPPPKVPEVKTTSSPMRAIAGTPIENNRDSMDGDYANLGDIRLHMTPKKPQRPSAVSFARDILETEAIAPPHPVKEPDLTVKHMEDNTYETLEAPEEEDHYTYLDESEMKAASKIYESQKSSCAKESATKQCTQVVTRPSERTENSPPRTQDDNQQPSCAPRITLAAKKPWLDLQASYAAIAAANYESLAELITTALSEGMENFQKTASSLQWSDFQLESEDPIQILEDKIVYNAIYKNQLKTKVTLLLTTQKQHTSQNSRNPTRPPLLASFNDYLPRQILNMGDNHCTHADVTKAMIYVLQRSKTTTVNQFALDSACFQTNQHIHLRNACFVLLQLIHTLKNLQADGIEEIDYDLGRILLLHTDADKPPILILLPGDKVYLTMTDFYKTDNAVRKTLCQVTLQLLFYLLQINDNKELSSCVINGEQLAVPVAHTFSAVAKVLSEEKASSLSQAKGLLEYMLWGPVDVKSMSGTAADNVDIILQRWLDLQRAQMVKSLVSNLHLKISSHTGLHVYEEYQLIFLLQATVKSLKDIITKL